MVQQARELVFQPLLVVYPYISVVDVRYEGKCLVEQIRLNLQLGLR